MICFNTRYYGKTGSSTAAVDELEFQAPLTWLERRRSPPSALGERSIVRSGRGSIRVGRCGPWNERFGEVGIGRIGLLFSFLPAASRWRGAGSTRVNFERVCGILDGPM